MNRVIVFEDAAWRELLPLTWWRATFELRCGIDTLLDKIEAAAAAATGLWVRPELATATASRQPRPVNAPPPDEPVLLVNGRLLPRERLALPVGSAAWQESSLLAAHVPADVAARLSAEALLDAARTRSLLAGLTRAELAPESYALIDHPWQLVQLNPGELRRQLTGRSGRDGTVHRGAHLLNEAAVRVERGAVVKPGAVLDAETGPILIEQGATISPNATVQGPCAVGRGALVQPGAVIREGTSIGPACKVGGEIEGTILQGCSNKQHHGFLGHAWVGEWVNLGAGTVNSDLKNTYGSVRVAINGRDRETGLMLVGSFIGDHAKTAINVALPTGAVIGFAANVLVSRFAPRFTPSFAWLTDDAADRYDPQRALAVARKVMARRKVTMSSAEEELFLKIAEQAPRIEQA